MINLTSHFTTATASAILSGAAGSDVNLSYNTHENVDFNVSVLPSISALPICADCSIGKCVNVATHDKAWMLRKFVTVSRRNGFS